MAIVVTGGRLLAESFAGLMDRADERDLDVRQAHEIASRIEGRIERALGAANATIHVEPAEEESSSDAPRPG